MFVREGRVVVKSGHFIVYLLFPVSGLRAVPARYPSFSPLVTRTRTETFLTIPPFLRYAELRFRPISGLLMGVLVDEASRTHCV